MEKVIFPICYPCTRVLPQAPKKLINGRSPSFLDLAIFSVSVIAKVPKNDEFERTGNHEESFSTCTDSALLILRLYVSPDRPY